MFYGEYKHNIDNKGRLILPAKFRETCKEYAVDRFFLARGLDACIFMFSEDEWRMQEQKFKNMPFTKQETRVFNRLLFSGADDVSPDKQGRFIIPSNLKKHANIKRDVIIIGVSNRIEIWDAKTWEAFYDNSSDTFEQTAENILSL